MRMPAASTVEPVDRHDPGLCSHLPAEAIPETVSVVRAPAPADKASGGGGSGLHGALRALLGDDRWSTAPGRGVRRGSAVEDLPWRICWCRG